jgi:hypothetical protein
MTQQSSGRPVLRGLVLICALSVAGAVIAQQAVIERYTGSGSGSAGPFGTEGPWMLTWSARSEFPTLAEFAVHLYDARSGRFLGLAVNHTGVGNGQKAILEPGDYRLVVVGRSVDWSIRIDDAPAEIAEFMRRRPDVTRVNLIPPRTGLRRDQVSAVSAWSADSDDLLILRMADGSQLRVGFHEGVSCPGLSATGSISFVTSGTSADLFNAILTEEGVRCYIGPGSVVE